MKTKIVTIFIIFLTLAPLLSFAEERKENKKATLPITFEAELDFLMDGDTFRIFALDSRTFFMVSLYGIDAPEVGQSYGDMAKDFVRKAIEKKKIEVKMIRISRSGTGLAYIYVDEKDLGLELVKKGLAEVDRGSSRAFFDPEAKKRYLEAQKDAQKNGVGIWALGDKHEYPADFLMRTKKKKVQYGDFN